MEENVIQNTIEYGRKFFSGDAGGHDFWHSLRVMRTAEKLAEEENADLFTVRLAALLHDVDDVKLSPETAEEKGNARAFLQGQNIPEEKIREICRIIGEISFEGKDSVIPSSPEGKCVQDADRLDAMGALGIARAFAYGGSHGRCMYDPEESPRTDMTAEEYHAHTSSSFNHFYEKLFLLKNMMNTVSGRRLAEQRDRYMHEFADEFLQEWEGKA